MKSVLALALLALAGCAAPPAPAPAGPRLSHLTPAGMHANPAFSQAVAVEGPHRTVYVGGQNAVAADGSIVGPGDIAAQCAQTARNLRAVLDAAGAAPEHVLHWTVHVVHGQDLRAGMQAFAQAFGELPAPPALSVVQVPALAHPAFLVEVSAVAVAPLSSNAE